MNTETKLYNQNKRMLHFYANRFSRRYHLEYDEVFSEANIIFCKSLSTYKDSKNASFSTHLFNNLKGRLNRTCRNMLSIKEKEIAFDHCYHSITYKENHCERIFFKEALNILSQEEKTAAVLNLILDPADIDIEKPRTTQTSIRRELKSNGWSRSEIEFTFKKIKEAL